MGLFVHLSEGQSRAADRCVCSRFGKGNRGEVRRRFFFCPIPCLSLPPPLPPRKDKDQVRMSRIDLFSPLAWTNIIKKIGSLTNLGKKTRGLGGNFPTQEDVYSRQIRLHMRTTWANYICSKSHHVWKKRQDSFRRKVNTIYTVEGRVISADARG